MAVLILWFSTISTMVDTNVPVCQANALPGSRMISRPGVSFV